MTLKEKLHAIYEAVDVIEKRGVNTTQKYKYIMAADVTNAIRRELRKLRVYAQINYDFVGGPYTIMRAKEPNAPFSAVNVKCLVVWHDLDSAESLTSSGLGSGADTGDKAAYKAQTGALKYALKNAFLVPDEKDADPEADEALDENSTFRSEPGEAMPDFHEAQHEAPRPLAAPRAQKAPERPAEPAPAPAAWPVDQPAPAPRSIADKAAAATAEGLKPGYRATDADLPGNLFGTPPATGPAANIPPDAHPTTMREPGEDPEPYVPQEAKPKDMTPPTEAELNDYRKKFKTLGDDLSVAGLKSSRSLPINRKLLTFMLQTTGAKDPNNISRWDWEDFFQRVERARKSETGLVGLGKLINRANGIDDTKKKSA